MKLIESEQQIVVEPAVPARACVIWMHGLGADGSDFVGLVPELDLPADAAVRFVFPHAPVRPVTLNGGMPMRAWFDIASLDRKGKVDETGIRESVARVRELVEEQRRAGIAAERIVLAGFSQGGVIALHTALRYPQRLGGLLALSTYLPLADSLTTEADLANREIPLLMCHGRFDAILPLELGEWSRDRLLALGNAVEWRAYPMAHEVCMDEIQRIGEWLAAVLKT